MKTLIIAGIFAISSTTAIAASSDFLSHIGGPEYNAAYSTEGMTFAQVEKSDAEPSLTRLIVESNVDGIAWRAKSSPAARAGLASMKLCAAARKVSHTAATTSASRLIPIGTKWLATIRPVSWKMVLQPK